MSRHTEIINNLTRIEQEYNVTILYACESGSRAWGFASVDSDYDIRFIYAHPLEWYLSIQDERDVIEEPVVDSLDISGWELRKALRLFMKSNPPLLEWLNSPIVYLENQCVTNNLRGLMIDYYSPKACLFHYYHMAKGNYRDYLKGDTVWLKKYLYVLRPILACQWIERGFGVVPTGFGSVIERVLPEGKVKASVNSLLEQKKEGAELGRAPRVPRLDEFIVQELERLESVPQLADGAAIRSTVGLDKLFRSAVLGGEW